MVGHHHCALLRSYLDAFKPLGLVPLLAPAELHAGDAIAGLDAAILARRETSFAEPVTWDAPATIRGLAVAAQAGACLGLGVPFADPALQAFGESSAMLRFDDATMETVSRTSLRQSVRPHAHQAVKRLFADLPTRLDADVMLVGQVLRARLGLRLERPQTGGALADLNALALRHGLRLRPVNGRTLRHAEVLELAETAPRTVAWRPALIDAGPLTPDTFRTINQMRPRQATRNFDPANEADLLVLSGWIDRQLARLQSYAEAIG